MSLSSFSCFPSNVRIIWMYKLVWSLRTQTNSYCIVPILAIPPLHGMNRPFEYFTTYWPSSPALFIELESYRWLKCLFENWNCQEDTPSPSTLWLCLSIHSEEYITAKPRLDIKLLHHRLLWFFASPQSMIPLPKPSSTVHLFLPRETKPSFSLPGRISTCWVVDWLVVVPTFGNNPSLPLKSDGLRSFLILLDGEKIVISSGGLELK